MGQPNAIEHGPRSARPRMACTCLARWAEISSGSPVVPRAWKSPGRSLECDTDQYAQAHPTALGEEKRPEQRGHYLDPDLHGQPPEGSTEWAMDPTAMRPVRHQWAALRAAVDHHS
jgi:hypothetical protein